MKLASSLSYKKPVSSTIPPRVSSTIPPEMAKRLSEFGDPDKCYAVTPLVAIVDRRLPDKAFRIRDLIAACSWKAPCPLTFGDIAFSVQSSRPQVIRHITLLEELGYIEVGRRGSRCNLYSCAKRLDVRASVVPVVEAAKRPMFQCPKCKRERPALLKAGICRSCNWELKVKRLVREEMAEARIA